MYYNLFENTTTALYFSVYASLDSFLRILWLKTTICILDIAVLGEDVAFITDSIWQQLLDNHSFFEVEQTGLYVQYKVTYPNFNYPNTSVIRMRSTKPHPLYPATSVDGKLFNGKCFRACCTRCKAAVDPATACTGNWATTYSYAHSSACYICSVQKFTFRPGRVRRCIAHSSAAQH